MLILNDPDPLQTLHFYQAGWSVEIEYKFLDELADAVHNGSWNPHEEFEDVDEVLATIGEGVNRCCNVHYGYLFYCEKLEFLKHRFSRFIRFLSVPGVKWDVVQNKITTKPSTWERLMRLDPGLMAYKDHGDPLFPHLRAVFYTGE